MLKIVDLSEIRSLSTRLEVEPLLGVVEFWRRRVEAERMVGIVGGDEVFKDGTGYPDHGAGLVVVVWVDEGGEATVGIELFVGGAFELVHGDFGYSPGEGERLEEYLWRGGRLDKRYFGVCVHFGEEEWWNIES